MIFVIDIIFTIFGAMLLSLNNRIPEETKTYFSLWLLFLFLLTAFIAWLG